MKNCMRWLADRMHAAILFQYGEKHFNEFCLDSWCIAEFTPNTPVCSHPGELVLISCEDYWRFSDLLPDNASILCAGSIEANTHTDRFFMLLCVDLDFSSLINAVNRIFTENIQLEYQFESAARIAKDIQQVAETAVPAFFDNLLISTMDFHYLANVYKPSFLQKADSFVVRQITGSSILEEFFEFMNNDKAFFDAHSKKEPFFYQTPFSPLKMLCMNVFYQGDTVCRLVMNCVSPLRGYESELMKIAQRGFMKQTHTLTEGNIGHQLIVLAFPLFVVNLVQQFFNTTDSIIIGRFLGESSFAAAGIAGTVMNLLVFILCGACTGISILLAQFYGRNDKNSMRREIFCAFLLGLTLTFLLCVVGIAALPSVLSLISTPEELFAETRIYLLIILIGLIAPFLYNFLSGILRAVGDTGTALLFLILSMFLNVLLDLLLVGVLHIGISGVAWATGLGWFLLMFYQTYCCRKIIKGLV